MDTATYNLTACTYCGAAAGVPCTTRSGRPTVNPHAAREKAADAIRAEQPEVAPVGTPRFGYVCKSCGGPSPVGVGYAVPGAAAEEASAELDACACGYSVRPVADAEYLPGTAPAGHPEHVTEDVTEQADDTAEDVTDTTPVTDVAPPASVLPEDKRPTTEQVRTAARLLAEHDLQDDDLEREAWALMHAGQITRTLVQAVTAVLPDMPARNGKPVPSMAELPKVAPYTPVDAPHEATSAPAAAEAPEDTHDDGTTPCGRCGGTGLYAMPNRWLRLPSWPHPKTGKNAPWCFECGGLGRVRYTLAG